MNNARIEQEADLALCQVAIQCPDAIVKTETSEEQLKFITGMGEDMTKLLQKSKTQAILFYSRGRCKGGSSSNTFIWLSGY